MTIKQKGLINLPLFVAVLLAFLVWMVRNQNSEPPAV